MATKIRKLSSFNGDAALYRLDDGTYVAVSAIDTYSGPETLVFPADEDGDVTDWGEIGGGRGYFDHERALATLYPTAPESHPGLSAFKSRRAH